LDEQGKTRKKIKNSLQESSDISELWYKIYLTIIFPNFKSFLKIYQIKT